LATNKRPKKIVIYVSPQTKIAKNEITDPVWFPAALLAAHHGGPNDWLTLLKARPLSLVEIPPIIMHSIGLSRKPMALWHEQMDTDGGRFDYGAMPFGRTPLQSDNCPGTPKEILDRGIDRASTRDALKNLRVHYATLGIPLFIYVAPIAQCDRALDAVRAAYRDIADNQPETLPNNDFTNEAVKNYHVHVNEKGATDASVLLGRFLADHLAPLDAGKRATR